MPTAAAAAAAAAALLLLLLKLLLPHDPLVPLLLSQSAWQNNSLATPLACNFLFRSCRLCRNSTSSVGFRLAGLRHARLSWEAPCVTRKAPFLLFTLSKTALGLQAGVGFIERQLLHRRFFVLKPAEAKKKSRLIYVSTRL